MPFQVHPERRILPSSPSRVMVTLGRSVGGTTYNLAAGSDRLQWPTVPSLPVSGSVLDRKACYGHP